MFATRNKGHYGIGAHRVRGVVDGRCYGAFDLPKRWKCFGRFEELSFTSQHVLYSLRSHGQF